MLVVVIVVTMRMSVDHRRVHVPVLMLLASQEDRRESHEGESCEERPCWDLPKHNQGEHNTDEWRETEQAPRSSGSDSSQ